MKHRLTSWRMAAWSVAGVLLAVALLVLVSMLSAQEGGGAGGEAARATTAGAEGKPTPRTADGHPDLNGYWGGIIIRGTTAGGGGGNALVVNATGEQQIERSADGSILFEFELEQGHKENRCLGDACQAANQPPYKPEYMAKVKSIAKTGFGGLKPDDPTNHCIPDGLPRAGGAIQFVQTPKLIAMLYQEAPYSTFRIIYTDGRSHPPAKDLEPSEFGDSVGHWEGDTLVVDTIGLSDNTWLGGSLATGQTQYTSIHSDKEHVTERWTRKGDILTQETTVEDPVMFTRPWVPSPKRLQLHADESLLYSTCTPTDLGIIRDQTAEGVDPSHAGTKAYCAIRCTDETK